MLHIQSQYHSYFPVVFIVRPTTGLSPLSIQMFTCPLENMGKEELNIQLLLIQLVPQKKTYGGSLVAKRARD